MSIPRIHQQALISASYVHLLSELVKKWKISPDELFWGTDIQPERFCDLTYKVSYVTFKKVVFQAIKLTKEPGISFYAGTQLKISTHGLLGLTAAISANALEAIETINRFVSLQCSFVELNLTVKNEVAYYNIIIDNAAIDLNNPLDSIAYEFCCIFFLTGFVHLVRFFFPEYKPDLDLECKYPNYFSKFKNILDSTFNDINFEQKHTRLISSANFLEMPLTMSDPLTSDKLKILCEKELEELFLKQDILYSVKYIIENEFETTQNIEQLAQKLNLTKRTLQRILQEKNTSFKEIYNNIRKEKALKLMSYKSFSRDEIAIKLGYSCSSSLNRALKRWGIS
ncbi:AraC family transcriptional regulator [Acinetobacter junii]|uniref:AraC family transcriptional regulator n=1 Tax=Acinetobacter junii TaxID=40215 RepID=UPI001F1EBE9C|nr:AraC family transcriptional regulator [Acinetobacter junii]UOB53399.1 AraC family transcriptional regulator [Acinetobacter junii]